MFSCFLGLCCQNGGPQRGGSGGISWEPDANADSRPKPPAQASLLLLTARPWHGAGARRHGEHPSRDPPLAGMVTGDTCSAPPLGGGTTHGPPGAPVGPGSIRPTGRPAFLPPLFLAPRCPRDHQPSSDLRNPHFHGAGACVHLCALCHPETGTPETRAASTGRGRRVLTLELRRQPNHRRRGRPHCAPHRTYRTWWAE